MKVVKRLKVIPGTYYVTLLVSLYVHIVTIATIIYPFSMSWEHRLAYNHSKILLQLGQANEIIPS